MHYQTIKAGPRHYAAILLIAALTATMGCASTARFDQYAYCQTTAAKVDALNVMDMAGDDYAAHVPYVKLVITSLDKVYEYERNRPGNKITLQLWDKLRDTSGHLFGGFVKRWKTDGKLRPMFISESKKEVAEAFDIIAQLESKKIKPKQAQ